VGKHHKFHKEDEEEQPRQGIIIVLDNLKSHKVEEVEVEAERLGIELVFLPPYSPDINPIEYVSKSIKRIISTTFVRHVNAMQNTIKEAFYRLTKKLSFATA